MLAQRRRFRDERLDDAFVGNGCELAFESAVPFGNEVGQAARSFAQGLGAREEIGDVVVAGDGEGTLGVEHLAVEAAQAHAHVLLLRRQLAALRPAAFLPRAQVLELAPGEVQADGLQLVDEAVVATSGVGLPLERAQAAPHFAQQVGETQQVALGRFEPALGLLPPLAELQDPGRFLDDRPPFLGPRVEHRVELTLPDDDVLLATDARVGEQLLDVEQAARRAVDHVLRVTGPEERPGDRHFRELDRQQPGGVVDGERHLGPAERGPIGGTGEDDVVHLGAAQRPRALGAEHPRDGVDDVRLARPVRPDHDTDAGFELERRLVGEGLEALQRQCLQEHAVPSPERSWRLGDARERADPRGGPGEPADQRIVKRRSPVGVSSSVSTDSTCARGGSFPAPGDHPGDGGGRPLELGLDRAVGPIPREAEDVQRPRLLAARVPEPHPLHAPRHDGPDPHALAVVHTWQASQKNVERFEKRARTRTRRHRTQARPSRSYTWWWCW